MSSLVKELNSGGNWRPFAFWIRILEPVSMVSPHRGRQRDREHRGFRIWTRWHFSNDLFGILLLIQAEVESLPRFRSSARGVQRDSELPAHLVVFVELAAQLGLASSDPVSCCRGAGAAEEESFENDLERQLEDELSLEELMKHRQEPDKVCMVRPERWFKTGRWWSDLCSNSLRVLVWVQVTLQQWHLQHKSFNPATCKGGKKRAQTLGKKRFISNYAPCCEQVCNATSNNGGGHWTVRGDAGLEVQHWRPS